MVKRKDYTPVNINGDDEPLMGEHVHFHSHSHNGSGGHEEGRSPSMSCLHKKKEDYNKYRKNRNRLIMVSIICTLFIGGEIAGGLIANSLAILSDAGHLFSDVAGFLISLGAIVLARRRGPLSLSFGWHRVEVIGAIISVLIIWVITAILVVEAVDRIRNPTDVDGKIMTIIAGVGIGVNLLMGYILYQGGHSHSHGGLSHSHESHGHSHNHENINIRSAFIHVIGDTVQTVGVLIAGIIIWVEPKYRIADPICTFIFSVLVLFTTLTILRDTLRVLMEGTPAGLDLSELSHDLKTLDGVNSVHGLHVWSITIGRPALAVHLEVKEGFDHFELLREAEDLICNEYEIHHTTIQIEPSHAQPVSRETLHCGDCCDPGDV